ncbi:thiamine pyrophosphate-dependent enzyme [Sphaerochaeta halotolerans]|uniref:thiamine pyrophosphate-dependent enzyme n=1 Tax=Sphaerochaeta halotolerans TaxID=2293840 RepID=UPI0013690F80|nr:thiamine pyrophosphate-dependent enzyme [Sphaerochaeta halotolerans]MXI85610.1 2-oxoacid ferredoxin oxidoreductase [Sphaerochaeta halotolerans]
MKQTQFDINTEIAWCPGCGNFLLLQLLKECLDELDVDPTNVVISSGIGQAAKMPQYVNTSFFNGLHGRGLPVATAISLTNPELLVIAEGGDGDMYGEGGNHFIHTIRRNPNIVHLVHNNMVYGLTKGQASPTSQRGFKTPLQSEGVISEPLNPLALAISLGAGFVARTFVGNRELTKEVIKQAVIHKGYALVDIFDPCVSFNKVNTFAWYKEHSYVLGDDWNASDKIQSLVKSMESDPFPLGVLYENPERQPTLTEMHPAYQKEDTPLFKRKRSVQELTALME